jgi:hypothetical protein
MKCKGSSYLKGFYMKEQKISNKKKLKMKLRMFIKNTLILAYVCVH